MLQFEKHTIYAKLVAPNGEMVEKPIEIRRNPITGRACRITFSRTEEREPGTAAPPDPPPFAHDSIECPFCPHAIDACTPRLTPDVWLDGRIQRNRSLLFPNLFPYGSHSAVSLFDDAHFVEIGTASPEAYADCLLNCRDFLLRILECDPSAVYMAITQNHLPASGGSLLHPHLQLQADSVASNHHRFLKKRAREHLKQTGRRLFSSYVDHERRQSSRLIGQTGPWEWLAAYAPEGFFEIWGILPDVTSIRQAGDEVWHWLARGVINVQRFYRSLNRNAYNLGMLSIEDGSDELELRAVMIVRSNYAAWVRSDHTGFEVMLGDMATFTAPEETAKMARPFWADSRAV